MRCQKTKQWKQGCFCIITNIKHNDWIFKLFRFYVFFLHSGVVQGTKNKYSPKLFSLKCKMVKIWFTFEYYRSGWETRPEPRLDSNNAPNKVKVGQSLTRQQRTRHQKKHRGPQEAYIPYFMNQSSSADFRPLFDSVNISSFHVTQQTSTMSNKPETMTVLGKG